jgi:hypothetical protein
MHSIRKSKMKTLLRIVSLIEIILVLELFVLAGYFLASILFWRLMPFHPLPFQLALLFGFSLWAMWVTDRSEFGFDSLHRRLTEDV